MITDCADITEILLKATLSLNTCTTTTRRRNRWGAIANPHALEAI